MMIKPIAKFKILVRNTGDTLLETTSAVYFTRIIEGDGNNHSGYLKYLIETADGGLIDVSTRHIFIHPIFKFGVPVLPSVLFVTTINDDEMLFIDASEEYKSDQDNWLEYCVSQQTSK